MGIRKLIYEKLHSNQKLTTLLANDGIYTTYSEDAGSYPVVVISLVDDVPAIHADNREIASHIRFQISIITTDAEFDEIESIVKKDLLELGAMRRLTTEFREDNLHYRILQFVIPNLEE
ncbi:MAG: hypothetical protein IKN12_00585 [Selenomonadaceae bacterium]|nr:hypothetical protein [Selenomonadaceae bacterium]